jgi:hypothetical protein
MPLSLRNGGKHLDNNFSYELMGVAYFWKNKDVKSHKYTQLICPIIIGIAI